MRLYLLRHAVASPRHNGADKDRSLTKEGRRKLHQAVPAMAELLEGVREIFSSPLLRSRQTAEVVAAGLNFKDKIQLVPVLKPHAPISAVLEMLSKIPRTASVLLVGHEPQLSRLAAALFCGAQGSLEFKKGALCAVDCERELGRGSGKLLWFLTPRQLRCLSR
jgi:phosphohistidine phosphatase